MERVREQWGVQPSSKSAVSCFPRVIHVMAICEIDKNRQGVSGKVHIGTESINQGRNWNKNIVEDVIETWAKVDKAPFSFSFLGT